ncbi:helix-turn-helix transcriptional regulator [Anaerotardibacter muris]|uniref:helix-turn-helix transcriptional regulator n=1 Tax=Anaerotardibacter muris TaxID=2941505 RepID=UPI00203C2731|nr:WYL domain-containing protein [Anaerotardibacter muris]
MPNNSKSKLKLLYLKQILEEETDAEHGLTMAQIIDRLDSYDIPAERKGIYRDLQTLREFGLDIQTYQRNPVEYAIVRRDFTLSQLMLLVDAVESCKFLTNRQSRTLITNLKLLASDHEREQLDRRIHVAGRITSKSESVFEYIDILHDAMRQNKQVEFMYYRYAMSGMREATHEGKPHVVTPVGITYAEGFYYLTAWNEERDGLSEFRIDRMDKLRVSDQRAIRNDIIAGYSFGGDEYESFGRFSGEPVTAELLVDGSKVEIIMDRFGEAAEWFKHDSTTAKAVVKIRKSEPFFGWVAGLGGTVRIHAPKSLKNEYREYLLDLAEGAK